METKKAIAIIPARGGSKRIPRKNIKDFLGKPIIAYSIEAALDSGLFDEVMVSTDDKEIAHIAIRYGAKVPFMRSFNNSDDNAGLADALVEVLDEYKRQGSEFNTVCCILATAPFVTKDVLKNSHEKLHEGCPAVVPVVSYSYPIQRALNIRDGLLSMNNPENYTVRSQDLEEMFHDAGQFYWIKSRVLLKEKKLFVSDMFGYVLSEKVVQDIDTRDDWDLAELKYGIFFRDNN